MTKTSSRSERSLVYSPPGTKLYAVGFMMGLKGHKGDMGGKEVTNRSGVKERFTTGYEVVRCGVYDGAKRYTNPHHTYTKPTPHLYTAPILILHQTTPNTNLHQTYNKPTPNLYTKLHQTQIYTILTPNYTKHKPTPNLQQTYTKHVHQTTPNTNLHLHQACTPNLNQTYTKPVHQTLKSISQM